MKKEPWFELDALPPCLWRAGTAARIGAELVARMPHLRHATWPPQARRLPRGRALATVSALVAAVAPPRPRNTRRG